MATVHERHVELVDALIAHRWDDLEKLIEDNANARFVYDTVSINASRLINAGYKTDLVAACMLRYVSFILSVIEEDANNRPR